MDTEELESQYWEDFLSIVFDDKSAKRRYRVCLESKGTLENKLTFLKYLDRAINSNNVDKILRESYIENSGENERPWFEKRSKDLEEIATKINSEIESLNKKGRERTTTFPFLEFNSNIRLSTQNALISFIHDILSENGFIRNDLNLFQKCFQENPIHPKKINWTGTQVTFVLFFERLKELKIISTENLYKALELNFTVKEKNIPNTTLSVISQKLTHIVKPRKMEVIREMLILIQKVNS